MITVVLSVTAAGLLTGHAHGAELAGWWTVIGSAVSVSLWGWVRGRRRTYDAPAATATTRPLPAAVDPDEYAAQMINCADLAPAHTIRVPAPRRASCRLNPTVDTAPSVDLVSGHSPECPALFHYPESYAGTTMTAPNVEDLIASLNRVMPG